MRKINKTELINHMMSTQNLTYEQASSFIDELSNFIQTQVASGNQIHIHKFGDFTANKRKSQVGRNPHTGESMLHPEHYVPHFKASENFRDIVKYPK